MASPLQSDLGTLFDFIALPQPRKYSLATSSLTITRTPEPCRGTVKESSSQLQPNPLSGIVRAKNKKIAEDKQKQAKQEMSRTKHRLRTSQVVKRLTKVGGFFTDNNTPSNEDSFDKETDKVDKKHGLLRAILKTKFEDSKYNQPDFYNQSFNRLQKGLKDIKLKQVLSNQDRQVDRQQECSTQSRVRLMGDSSFCPANPEVSTLTPQARIRMQSCKKWAMRHNKRSQFYRRRLSSLSLLQQRAESNNNERGKYLNSIKSLLE